ncbi:MAG: prenyltransferase/squalene oxidase repeat-containing protein [Verrucomicrobiota bacterium]
MSIHIKLSEEAEAEFRKQKRNSSIFSIIISGLIITMIILVLGLIALNSIPIKVEKDFEVTHVKGTDLSKPEPPKVKNETHSKPTPPSRQANNAIVSHTLSDVSIPSIDVDVTSPSFGMSDDGFSYGVGDITGEIGIGDDKFKKIIGVFSKRCTQADRLARLKEMGGRVETEETVERGLEWLKANQNADGSWSNRYTSAMTGFGVLAYLGRCETPTSQKYGESCMLAITYLVNLGMQNDGKLAKNTADKHWPYEHAIATYALCEAVTFCEQLKITIPNLEEVTQKSVDLIIKNQHEKSGGWEYSYDTQGNRGGDLSIVAWHIQALKAASHTGLEFKDLKNAQSKAMEYVENMQGENGGFGYASKPSGEGYAKLTGAGVLCLQMSGKNHATAIRKGTKHILELSKFDYAGKDSNLYSHYYESQAMMARGGSEWEKYNEMFQDQLINSQNPDGSWKIPGSGAAYADPHYRTCLNILMLEVYYRFLPGTGKL